MRLIVGSRDFQPADGILFPSSSTGIDALLRKHLPEKKFSAIYLTTTTYTLRVEWNLMFVVAKHLNGMRAIPTL